ncbi:CBS domain-containing protein [Corallococcus sp. CA053C]|uniref:CBS domain-containing protein n=1 Tax=Corallococcus sp. CA053C TaxID=2316732 RepID=UPI000EA10E01|nr:CBS domain-containing protein [Corallococcus sp. CA053C]RKG98438.1 CBS domain-containing protein [Corallococcus sp. CA053C]
MRQGRGFKEVLSSFIATVFPTDTLLGALKVMERHHVRVVGVVGAEGGLVGVVHEAHVLAAWRADPLAPVSDIMARVRKPPAAGLGDIGHRRLHRARLAARTQRRQKLF